MFHASTRSKWWVVPVPVLLTVLIFGGSVRAWTSSDQSQTSLTFDSAAYVDQRLAAAKDFQHIDGAIGRFIEQGCGQAFWTKLFESRQVEAVYFALERISPPGGRYLRSQLGYWSYYGVDVVGRDSHGYFWAEWEHLPHDVEFEDVSEGHPDSCCKMPFEIAFTTLTEEQVTKFLQQIDSLYDIAAMASHQNPSFRSGDVSRFAFAEFSRDSERNLVYINDVSLPTFHTFYELGYWYGRLLLFDEYSLFHRTYRSSAERPPKFSRILGLDSAGIDSVLKFWPPEVRPSWDSLIVWDTTSWTPWTMPEMYINITRNFDSAAYVEKRLAAASELDIPPDSLRQYLERGCGQTFWRTLYDTLNVEEIYFCLESIETRMGEFVLPQLDSIGFFAIDILGKSSGGYFWARWDHLGHIIGNAEDPVAGTSDENQSGFPEVGGLRDLRDTCCSFPIEITITNVSQEQLSNLFSKMDSLYDISDLVSFRDSTTIKVLSPCLTYFSFDYSGTHKSLYFQDVTPAVFETLYELGYWHDRILLSRFCESDLKMGGWSTNTRLYWIYRDCRTDSAGVDSILHFWPPEKRTSWDSLKSPYPEHVQ